MKLGGRFALWEKPFSIPNVNSWARLPAQQGGGTVMQTGQERMGKGKKLLQDNLVLSNVPEGV